MLEEFKKAIDDKKVLRVKFQTKDGTEKARLCIPFDFGPSRRNLSPNPDRYHFYDLDSPDGQHNLSLEPGAIKSLEVTDTSFEPGDYIKWKTNWFLSRDWGQWS